MFHSVGGKTCVSHNPTPQFESRSPVTLGELGLHRWIDGCCSPLRDSIKDATYNCLFQSSNVMVILTAHSAVVAVPNVAKNIKVNLASFPQYRGPDISSPLANR
ncbi:Uncharacterized protein HZ326_9872 [Fusarium oxysporum f. sp. albedinis]|nr:Uncharacterized protein HZ326_9872 [Fusarium oxysporum f. sp. albedinis]